MDTYEEHFETLIELARASAENSDLQIEIIGTLVYINSKKWDEVVIQGEFLEFVHLTLTSGAEDDLILECIMLVATLARNEKCCEAISKTMLIGVLHDLLGAK